MEDVKSGKVGPDGRSDNRGVRLLKIEVAAAGRFVGTAVHQ